MSSRRDVILNCVLVRIETLNASHESVDAFHPELKYLHAVELVKNNGLWPIELAVQSTIPTQEQLAYLRTGAAQKWEFSATILPDGSFPEQVALVDCVKRVSGREAFTTTFTSDSGFRDRLAIQVRIKDLQKEERAPAEPSEEVPVKK